MKRTVNIWCNDCRTDTKFRVSEYYVNTKLFYECICSKCGWRTLHLSDYIKPMILPNK